MKHTELESDANGIKVQFSIGPEDAHRDYGHLHHPGFVNCYDICRSLLQEKYGVSDENLARRGMKLVIYNHYLEIGREVFPGDTLDVYSYFSYSESVRVFIEHEMSRGGDSVSHLRSEHVFIKDGKVIRPLREFIGKLMESKPVGLDSNPDLGEVVLT